jgi:hypothetical protein
VGTIPLKVMLAPEVPLGFSHEGRVENDQVNGATPEAVQVSENCIPGA